MSKIQDALRKIQSGAGSRQQKPVPAGETSRIAALTIAPPEEEEDLENYDGRIVTIDRQLLRSAGLLAPEDQEPYIAEQYRIIKRPILDLMAGAYADKPEFANLVMIASALPGDGKTFNAINIALSMAVEKDTSVLLVDADVAKPHVSELFGLQGEPGLIDVLTDESLSVDNAIIRSDVPGLSLLPAGRSNPHATELLASRRMARMAAHLSESVPNRIVIFDSPPLLVTSESRVLASRMGQIALVVCAGKTPRQAIDSVLDSLDTDKAVNLILNQAGTSFADAAYGSYQYGYGYGERAGART